MLWSVKHVPWSIERKLWFKGHVLRSVEHVSWPTVHVLRFTEDARWPIEHVLWAMAHRQAPWSTEHVLRSINLMELNLCYGPQSMSFGSYTERRHDCCQILASCNSLFEGFLVWSCLHGSICRDVLLFGGARIQNIGSEWQNDVSYGIRSVLILWTLERARGIADRDAWPMKHIIWTKELVFFCTAHVCGLWTFDSSIRCWTDLLTPRIKFSEHLAFLMNVSNSA